MNFKETAQWLLSRDNFLILTHVRPDGDTVGSAVGLCHALREQGKTAHILPNSDATSLFTPYMAGLLAEQDGQYDTVVAVDIATVKLLPQNARPLLEHGIDLTIDHHSSQEFFAKSTCLDGDRASCGELVYDIVHQWGDVSARVALPLYLAVSTDTGCFVYSSTNADTHRVASELLATGISFYPVNKTHFRTKSFIRLKLESLLTAGMQVLDDGEIAIVALSLDMIASLNAREEDIEDISSFVGQIEGVKTGVTVRELKPGLCKISLRSEPERLNASHVCALLGGGGHAAASGASYEGDIQATTAAVLSAIRTIQAKNT